MEPVLFDTSLYVSALRAGPASAAQLSAAAASSEIWLSSVVLGELYAGAKATDRRIVERLEEIFDRAQRILVPNLTDWTQTGKILALLRAKYDYVRTGRGQLTNDALIATSAGRKGVTILTANPAGFIKLAEFCPFHWRNQ